MATDSSAPLQRCQLDSRLSAMSRLRQPVWIYDFDNACVAWGNAGSLDIWQADSLEALCSRDMRKDMTPTVAKRLRQYQTDFLRDEDKQFREVWTLYPNGEPVTLEVVYSAFRFNDDRMGMMCEALPDLQFDADTLRSAEALLHTSVMITLYSTDGVPLYRNPAARGAARVFSESLQDHYVSDETFRLLRTATGEEVKTVACAHTNEGPRWHDITALRCRDAVSGCDAWLISEVDVSRLKATEERAQFLAEHDQLTGLPNRNHVSVAFRNQVEQLLAQQKHGAVIFIDLDHFKDINDSLGHEAGDKLLVNVAERLKTLAQNENTIARLGGDEFLMLIGPIDDDDEVREAADQIRQILSLPIVLQGRKVHVTPSIGISMFPQDGHSISDLMRNADLAMYHAKEHGRNDFSFFDKQFSDAVESRINLESELQTALNENQFVTYFQPRVDVHTNTITGAEALVRWIHPQRGLVSPGTFIPACEASDQIGRLGKYVLAQAVIAQQQWKRAGFNLRISVNLSPLQFGEDSLVEDIVAIVNEHHGTPDSIELEITESVLLGHDQKTIDKLHALVNHGFRIAIDDFGTGYSNLAYLHRYPIRCLKIDKSFVSELDTAQPIVELIISMAKLFKFDVVAEGVETPEQLDVLKAYDCHEYQGFLFARPVDFDSFTTLMDLQRESLAA
jgi:diguanylate cyclase (GGDEF)-like protein